MGRKKIEKKPKEPVVVERKPVELQISTGKFKIKFSLEIVPIVDFTINTQHREKELTFDTATITDTMIIEGADTVEKFFVDIRDTARKYKDSGI